MPHLTPTLNPGDLWCGVVTPAALNFTGFGLIGYGYSDVLGDGALSDTEFPVGTNSYTIDSVLTETGANAGNLLLSLTSALTATDKEKLVLHVQRLVRVQRSDSK